MTLLFVSLLIGTVAIILTHKKSPYAPEILSVHSKLKKPESVADVRLLLTMYGVRTRKAMYQETIQQWLNQTNMQVYAVNSGGEPIGITHDRFHEFVFTQKGPFVCPTYHESDSIMRALDHFQFPNNSIVLKMTAKYFCPELEDLLGYVPQKTNLVLQSRHLRREWCTEMFGMRPNTLREFMSVCSNNSDASMEKHMYRFLFFHTGKDAVRMPKLSVTGNNKRDCGDILTYL